MSKKIKIKKSDILLLGGIIIVAVVALIIIQFFVKKDGSIAIVKVDGEIQYQLDLSKNTEITITGHGGSNTIAVTDGYVYMKDADCPDKICVNTGKINKSGETIVCLPHRITVEVEGKEAGYDSIAR